MSTAQAVLDSALDWYESEDRWCKYDYATRNGVSSDLWTADRLCLKGALARGARVNELVYQLPVQDWPNDLLGACQRVAHEIDPGNHVDSFHWIIECFNDRDGTTFEDARLVLKRAAEQGSK